MQTQPQYFRVVVEGELDLADIVAPVLVGEDDLGALAAPFDRTAELLCRPQGQAVLDILPALGAKAAADIVADHPDFALRHLEDHVGQHVAHPVRVVDVGIERVAVLAGIVSPDGATRLHVLGLHPADHIAPPDDVTGAGEGRLGLGLVAPFIGVGDVVGVLVPDPRRIRQRRIGRRGDRGQRSRSRPRPARRRPSPAPTSRR